MPTPSNDLLVVIVLTDKTIEKPRFQGKRVRIQITYEQFDGTHYISVPAIHTGRILGPHWGIGNWEPYLGYKVTK